MLGTLKTFHSEAAGRVGDKGAVWRSLCAMPADLGGSEKPQKGLCKATVIKC